MLHVAWAEHNSGAALRACRARRLARARPARADDRAARGARDVPAVLHPPRRRPAVRLPRRPVGARRRAAQPVRRAGAAPGACCSIRCIAGEGQRNAYVNQLAIDARGGWHLSWVWRESPDVATNHDVLYAHSPDEGRSWRTSTGAAYALPITARTAEVAWRVPQGSELINQTSGAVDRDGRPVDRDVLARRGSEVPQLRLVWHDGTRWRASQVGERTLAFRLSGGGTKRIPLSRPQVLVGRAGDVIRRLPRPGARWRRHGRPERRPRARALDASRASGHPPSGSGSRRTTSTGGVARAAVAVRAAGRPGRRRIARGHARPAGVGARLGPVSG